MTPTTICKSIPKIEFFNNNHGFIKNTCKKFDYKDASGLWGSISIKLNTIVVNLSAMKKFYEKYDKIIHFAEVISYVIAHEMMHKEIIAENTGFTIEQEDDIIDRTLSNDWRLKIDKFEEFIGGC